MPDLTAAQTANLIAAAAVLAIFVIGLFQVLQNRKSMNSYHERRMKESTLAALEDLSRRNAEQREQTVVKYSREDMSAAQVAELINISTQPIDGLDTDQKAKRQEARDERSSIRDVLNDAERLAVGVRLGVYDLDTVDEVLCTQLINLFERHKHYIAKMRDAGVGNRAYITLESLVTELRKKKTARSAIPSQLPGIGTGASA